MEASPATPLLSVSELYDAQAARATYERLVDVINAQAAALERLARRVGTLETTQRHAVAAQQHALSQADVMVAQLEALRDAQARVETAQRSQQTRVDELVLVVSRDSKLLETTVERVARTERNVETTVEKLKRELAPLDLVTRLHDAQDIVHDRIAAIDVRLNGKLDKSEMSRLDDVVGKIQAFAPTATQLTTRVGQIEDAHRATSQRLDDEVVRANRLRRDLDELQMDLTTKVAAESWHEFIEGTFDTTIDRLQADANATSTLVNDLVHRGVSLETSQRTLSSKLTSIVTGITGKLEAFRAETMTEMKTKLDRGEVDQSLKEIRHELSCKAWRKETQIMNEDLAQLLTKFDKMMQQVALSTRFLDWYATRGEAFERNMNVVENQLERLAHASAPQLRQPFGNQVRYSD